MNFFEQQDRARRNSSVLVILMILAVTALITMTSLCLVTIWEFAATGPRLNPRGYVLVVGCVALGVISVVLLGALYKHFQLSDGGKVVAERLGGRLISLQPMGLAERRLLNVVEEMALASGTPVPPVYVLDEPSINAFAAGLTPQDAVIGITRGALHTLDRDELQGVIAHEFSHIFHGDMRLNTRLVSVLLDSQTVGLKALEEAVKGLTRLWSLQKPQLLKAMLASLMHDGRIEPAEAELMRAIPDCIDCPMPPLLH